MPRPRSGPGASAASAWDQCGGMAGVAGRVGRVKVLIELRGVTKSFPAAASPASLLGSWQRPLRRARREVLSSIDLALPAGGAVALVGRNGAGKTTLLRVIAGLAPPDSGRISIAGEDLTGRPERLRRLSGFAAASERGFFERLSVRENLRFFAALHGAARGELRAQVDDGLAEVGLAQLRDRPFRQLSSGERQRLVIARGLLGRPAILLLDEPTRSLDAEGADRLHALLAELRRSDPGRTVIFSTHHPEEAANIAERTVALEEGRIVPAPRPVSTPSYTVRTSPPLGASHVRGLALLEGIAGIDRPATTAGASTFRLRSAEALDALVDALRARGLCILELSPQRGSPHRSAHRPVLESSGP